MNRMKKVGTSTSDQAAFKAIDLFAGCGGLTQGLKDAGFRVVGAVEIDKAAARAYESNHPEVRLWRRDIRSLSASQVTKNLQLTNGELDVLAGCPPCEGFSSLRTLNGHQQVDDPRNDLIFEFLRFVRRLRPKTVMLENVPALKNDERFRKFVRELRLLGYIARFKICDAANFGVAQRRKRLLLLASRVGSVRFARRARKRLTISEVIGSLPKSGHSGDLLHDFPEHRKRRVLKLIQMIPKDGGSRADLGYDAQLACHKRCSGFRDVYGRMRWKDVAPTITSGCVNPSKGRFLHPEEDRCITLREAALLQSFPLDYQYPVEFGKYAIARMIGNALPPTFVSRHAAQLKKVIAAGATG